MHMGFFYYVICVGALLIFTVFYMQKYWTEDVFKKLTDED